MNKTAVILAGGYGTRLGDITLNIPKPMVEIGGKPILWHIMKNYAQSGISNFVILTGYRSEVIKDYFINFQFMNRSFRISLIDGKVKFYDDEVEPWTVTLVDSGLDASTGTRIRMSEKYIDSQEFFITYGDGLSNIDHHKAFKFFKESDFSLILAGVTPPGRYGVIELEQERVKSFREKRSDKSQINGGFFIGNKSIFENMPQNDFSFEDEYLPTLASRNLLGAYLHDGFWQSMDTPRDLQKLQNLWETRQAPWKTW